MYCLRIAVLVAALMGLTSPLVSAEEQRVLVKDGASDWHIVISKFSIPSEHTRCGIA